MFRRLSFERVVVMALHRSADGKHWYGLSTDTSEVSALETALTKGINPSDIKLYLTDTLEHKTYDPNSGKFVTFE